MNREKADDSTVSRPGNGPQEPTDHGVAERFRSARLRGQPFWLWPEIDVRAWRRALGELEAAARSLLLGREPAPLNERDSAGARALCLAAYTSGLGPWLGWQVERGLLAADDLAAGELREHLAQGRARWPRIEKQLAALLRRLEEAGIRATLLKGAHTARGYFDEPALRPMSDIDVLVDAGEVMQAERVLGELGYEENAAARIARPSRSEWRPRDAPPLPRTLMHVHADDVCAVDLHGSADIDFFGVRAVRFDRCVEAMSRRSSFHGAPVLELRQPLLAAHLAVHASHGLHSLTMIRLVELVLVFRQDFHTPADWRALHAQLRELQAERFAYPALALTQKLAPGTVDPDVLAACARAAPRRLRRVVERLRPATAQRLDELALEERFMWSSGVAEHVRRAGAMLLPTGPRGSISRLRRIYVERVFRVLRGHVSWRSAPHGEPRGRHQGVGHPGSAVTADPRERGG